MKEHEDFILDSGNACVAFLQWTKMIINALIISR